MTTSIRVFATLLALALGLVGPAVISEPAQADDGVGTYEVTVSNLTDGQYLTPPNWVIHAKGGEVFALGSAASAGITSLAENGGVPVLAAELVARFDSLGLGDSGVALPPGAGDPPVVAPGASRSFTVTTSHDRISVAAMLVCTNDGFAGLDAKSLPDRVGHTKQYQLGAYDAGTEINTEADADLVPAPFCADPAIGSGMSNPDLAQHGVVRHHLGITGIGDLDGSYDWVGPVASITIERVG